MQGRVFKDKGWGGGSSEPPEPALDPPLAYKFIFICYLASKNFHLSGLIISLHAAYKLFNVSLK